MLQYLLITGEKRSGTTLTANFLNAQDGITVYRDFLHIERLQQVNLGGVPLDSHLTVDQRHSLIKSFQEWSSALETELELHLNPIEFRTILEFYQYVLQYIAGPNDSIVGHKSTMAQGILRDLLLRIPNLKVLYCLRDPRDVVTSALKRFENEEDTLFDYIESWESSYYRHEKLILDPQLSSRILVLKYEDFILDVDATIEVMQQFLGGIKLEKAVNMTDYGKHWQDNSAFGDIQSGFDTKPIGRWKEQNPEAGRITEILLEDKMQEVDYQISKLISEVERLTVRAQYEYFQLRKMGVPLREKEPISSTPITTPI
jgi:hypothetical protein